MFKDSYYQKNKKKNIRKRCNNLSEEEKQKIDNMNVNDIEISLKMKSKSFLIIGTI